MVSDRFDAIAENATVVDIEEKITVGELFARVAEILGPKMGTDIESVRKLPDEREAHSHTAISADIAVSRFICSGTHRFEMLLLRIYERNLVCRSIKCGSCRLRACR